MLDVQAELFNAEDAGLSEALDDASVVLVNT
jgi:hypothetical protein